MKNIIFPSETTQESLRQVASNKLISQLCIERLKSLGEKQHIHKKQALNRIFVMFSGDTVLSDARFSRKKLFFLTDIFIKNENNIAKVLDKQDLENYKYNLLILANPKKCSLMKSMLDMCYEDTLLCTRRKGFEHGFCNDLVKCRLFKVNPDCASSYFCLYTRSNDNKLILINIGTYDKIFKGGV